MRTELQTDWLMLEERCVVNSALSFIVALNRIIIVFDIHVGHPQLSRGRRGKWTPFKGQMWTFIQFTACVSSAISSRAPPVQSRCSWPSLPERRTAPRCSCSPRARLRPTQTEGFKRHTHRTEQCERELGKFWEYEVEKLPKEVVTWWCAGPLQWADSGPDSLTPQQKQLYQRDCGPL